VIPSPAKESGPLRDEMGPIDSCIVVARSPRHIVQYQSQTPKKVVSEMMTNRPEGENLRRANASLKEGEQYQDPNYYEESGDQFGQGMVDWRMGCNR